MAAPTYGFPNFQLLEDDKNKILKSHQAYYWCTEKADIIILINRLCRTVLTMV